MTMFPVQAFSQDIGQWAKKGHVIITTRNSPIAFHQAISVAIEITSWDVKLGSEFLMFLLESEIGKDLETEGVSAQELSRRLSGHALGISHMAGLIHRRSCSTNATRWGRTATASMISQHRLSNQVPNIAPHLLLLSPLIRLSDLAS
ncbi:hypothetical protein F4803DRAFT_504786 [Xylaria telfairii]|nr:hypothetical protein F4803DRAFT_504786 [Xylaria telfairii]